jgi:transposase-like protein
VWEIGEGLRMRNTKQTKQTGARRRRTWEQREEIVARYRQSGLTQRVFAQTGGLSVSTLQYWLRQTRADQEEKTVQTSRSKDAPSVSWLEVELDGQRSAAAQLPRRYEIELASGVVLRVGHDFADGEVRRLLALLREARP